MPLETDLRTTTLNGRERPARRIQKNGNDPTSAKIESDNIRIRLFLAAHDLPSRELRMARWNRVSQIGEIGEITEVRDHFDTSIVPATEVDQKTDSRWDFGFQPLTEEEKKAFVDSLDANGKRILRELAGENTKPNPKTPSAAPTAA